MSKIVWCNSWKFPFRYGFVPDVAAWNREMKRLKVSPHNEPYPDTAAGTATFNHRIEGRFALVTVTHTGAPQTVSELLVHEAMHVFRAMMESLGEDRPSPEFEAYTVQTITSQLFDAYACTRGPLFRRGRTK